MIYYNENLNSSPQLISFIISFIVAPDSGVSDMSSKSWKKLEVNYKENEQPNKDDTHYNQENNILMHGILTISIQIFSFN